MPTASNSGARRGSDDGSRKAERNNSKGEATRRVILLTAERLFAEHGIAGVAMRDIGSAAGQKNSVAVQYHFGDREGLLRAITTYRAAESEADRIDMIVALLAEGRQPVVPDLVKVFVHPMARHLDKDNHYLAFLSRYVIDRGGYVGFDALSSGETVTTLVSLFFRLMPDYPRHLLEERWTIMMTSAVHALARYQALSRAGKLPAPIEDLLVHLELYLTAGLKAPLPASAEPGSMDETVPGGRRR